MSREHFERFCQSFLGDSQEAAREGLDLDALAGLDDQERAAAETMLLARLAHDDDRAAAGLGAMGSARAAEPLRQRLQTHRDEAATVSAQRLLTVALALWQVARDREAFEAMVDVLRRAPVFTMRRAAADALAQVRLPESSQALAAALADDASLVRHASALSLLRLHGLPAQPPPASVWGVMSSNADAREQATRELLAAVASNPL